MPDVEPHSDQEDAQLLDDAARDAGAMALEFFHNGTESWKKADGSPISKADMAVDEMLRQRLMKARPDYGWLSEETADNEDRLHRPRVFIVDPIDGTSAFLAQTNNWCVALAIVEAGRPVVASVMRPATGEHFAARLGGGAFCNGAALKVSSRRELAGSHLVAHPKALRSARWKVPFPEIKTGMSTSLVLRLCLVASGAYDGAVATGQKNEWDLAAGDLITHEAGGVVRNFAGDMLQFNQPITRQRGMVGSGPALIEQLLERTRHYEF